MDTVSLLIGAAFYIGWCMVNGMIADAKHRSTGLALGLSLVFTPVLPYLYLLAVPTSEPDEEDTQG